LKRSEAHELGASEYHGAVGHLPVSTTGTPHSLSVAFVDRVMANGHSLIEDFTWRPPFSIIRTRLSALTR
jgi:choline dehydrogenase